MPRGFLSARIDDGNALHHLWTNNGAVWWIAYTLHFGNRKRRIRRSLKTSDVQVAIARRDALFEKLRTEGEDVPERRRSDEDERRVAFVAVTRPTQNQWSIVHV
ncbi:MAG: hypothetical protein EBT03_10755 [Betaproteobacteria bacterium]|nr:hypothetical protein [Betaproteobacteria bacterium]NCA17789.1 hypothetical protein [Betaproteobacteria bacterium]